MIGSMFSGYFQAAVYKNLNGKNGIEGWRWLFIIDFIVTIPVAILGYIVLIPNNAKKVWWLTSEELQLSKDRMKFRGEKPNDVWDWKAVKRILSSWQFWVFPSAYVLWDLSGQGGSYFAIIMKGLGGYSVYQINTIPTIQSVFRIITSLASGFIIDITAKRWHSFLGLMILWLIGLSIVVAWDVSRAGLFFGIILLGVSTPISPLFAGWINQSAQEDVQLKTATMSVMNLFCSLLEIPWNVKLFNTDYAPRYYNAYRWCLGLNSILLLYVPLILLFDRYQNRKRGLYKIETTKSDGSITVRGFFDEEENDDNSDKSSTTSVTKNTTVVQVRSTST
ncbi:putative transporter SEO1 [Wickerhamomyces ciferrii]|uniref:Transporter SEO1 n=1 Tax=Wickerhamomyces ciferrii (strain ATCC 14091 / BCRC 22168 / CBS 111 / JCM 3599 / NBRC 0793 / NRRL Y-1031 F-60-10) TaxID=1206466 RepID=K0L0G7_WICCF|nr:putative transporter SEO1 [Wickerhamomyces ciferrii]CCH46928.1 putative transporter SEO1 [Wickerhamomyces ciferrii]